MNEMKEGHKKYAIISLAAVVAIGILAWLGQSFIFGGEAAAVLSVERDRGEVPIEKVFDEKIVYTTDSSYPSERLADDCRERGGEFNECGSSEDGSGGLVCAYTCEF